MANLGLCGIQNRLAIRGEYLSAYGEYAESLLPYSRNTPRDIKAELGASLFQIAQSLIALERILFSRAKERFKKKIEER